MINPGIAKEIAKTKIQEAKTEILENKSEILETPVRNTLENINNDSLESIKAQNESILSKTANLEKNGLSNKIKENIRKETGWSDEIINKIKSEEEYKIYKNANLQEAEINGKKVLIQRDINWEQKDSMRRTNLDRAKAGLSPISKDGNTIELHHIGQENDSPLAELTKNEHRGKENYSILHNPEKVSEINRIEFEKERIAYWKKRAIMEV